jgi:YgiT-type zinc finger domain-containing protein
MRCVICKEGDTAPGRVTVTLQRGDTVIIVRDVPAARLPELRRVLPRR